MNYEDLEGEFLQYASIVKLTEGQEMTGAEIAATIAGLKNGIDLFKGAASAKDAATNSHFVHVISSMELQLSNLETELAGKNRELIAKDKEIAQLKEKLAQPKTKAVLVKREKYWYTPEDAINPVCSVCHDLHDKITRLVPTDRSTKIMTKHQYQCRNCKTTS